MSSAPKKPGPVPVGGFTPPDFDRPLPNNRDAERLILGSIIIDNQCLAEIQKFLRADDFFFGANRIIFGVMCDMAGRGAPIDTLLLMHALEKTERLAAVGGSEYLSLLTDGLPRPVSMAAYCRVVKELAIRREVIHVHAAGFESAFGATCDLDILLDRSQSALSSISLQSYVGSKSLDDLTLTPKQVCAGAHESILYIAYPFAAPGMIALVDGKPKLAGKTTVLAAAIAAGKRAGLFLNRGTKSARILFVTEEGEETFAIALRKAGLAELEGDGLAVLFDFKMKGQTWEQKAAYIEELCEQKKIEWLIIDTFYKIVGLAADKENDSSTVSAAVAPLRQIASRLGCAVTLTRHERKSGGEVGQSGRGSNALDGDVDIICRIQRRPGIGSSQKREMEIVSRIENRELPIELTSEGEYRVEASNEVTDEFGFMRVTVTPYMKKVIAFVKANQPCERARIFKARKRGGAGMRKEFALEALIRCLEIGELFEESGCLSTQKTPERF